MYHYSCYDRCIITFVTDRRGGVEVERSPHMREIGVRSPVATDLSRNERKSEQAHIPHAPTLLENAVYKQA